MADGDRVRPDRAWGGTFDAIADVYDGARPGYPPELYDLLTARCGLGPGTEVLEVGCGTGQATRDLLGRGATVTAIEPGPALAALARRNLAGRPARIVGSSLEAWPLDRPGGYDLATSATAFHWVEPEAGITKLAAALRPGGWMALWWLQYGAGDGDDRPDPLHDAVEPLLERWDRRQRNGTFATQQVRTTREGIRTTPAMAAFADFREDRLLGVTRHSARGMRELWSTFSPVLTMPAEARAGLLDDIERLVEDRFGGMVERPCTTVCFTASRR